MCGSSYNRKMGCLKDWHMTALKWIRQFKHLPMSTERPATKASNAEIKRWIKSGSVLFNAEKVDINDEIDFEIFSLVFFPKGKRKTTFI